MKKNSNKNESFKRIPQNNKNRISAEILREGATQDIPIIESKYVIIIIIHYIIIYFNVVPKPKSSHSNDRPNFPLINQSSQRRNARLKRMRKKTFKINIKRALSTQIDCFSFCID